jgi:GMP reductase
MRIEVEIKLDFKDVLIRPKRSTLTSRKEVELKRIYTFRHSGRRFDGIPVIAANMDTVGTLSMALALAPFKAVVALHKYYGIADLVAFFEAHEDILPNILISTGITAEDEEKLAGLLAHDSAREVMGLCIDAANGYTESFVDCVKKTRDRYPGMTIIAGNVVTGEMVEALILSGADIVKAGIGPGSVCTTRKMTGVGYPQLSAIIECADAAHGLGGHLIGDGGCVIPGDLAKAFGGGADFVMLGGMLAGHQESEGERTTEGDREYISFYGMSSATAMEKHSGGVADYRASEGKSVKVPYRGNVEATFQEILGGLRSSCTYVGARNLKELPKRTTFIRVTQQLNEVFGT